MGTTSTEHHDLSADGERLDRRVVAVVLAAGAGERFVGPIHKLNARIGDVTIAAQSIRRALEADIGSVVVVTGETRLEGMPPRAIEIPNPNASAGQATSLTLAVDYARHTRADAIVVGLADQPFVTADAWRRVGQSTADIAYATYQGRRGHPVRFSAAVWDRLPTSGDAGGGELIRVYQGQVDAIPCTGSDVDIDTVEDLETWQNNSSTNSPSTDRSTRPGH